MREDRIAKRREEIINAALDLFAQKGYHETKISDIAKRLNIAHGTCYLYYKSKFEIFSAVVEKIMNAIADLVLREAPQATNTLMEHRAQLERIGNALIDFFLKDMRVAKILFWALPGVDPGLDAKVTELLGRLDQYTEQYLLNGVEKGFLKKDLDTEVFAKAANGLILAGVRHLMASGDPRAYKEIYNDRWVNAILQIMLEGMA